MANQDTKLQNLVNPEVLADMISQKLTDAMKFAPLCVIDNTLEGRPGDTVTLPQFSYIGDALEYAELQEIYTSELEATTQAVKVKKVAKHVLLSDEAMLSGYGDPVGEVGNQLVISIANKLDNDVMAAMNNATLIHSVISVGADDVNEALIKLGEDFEGEKYLFVGAASYAKLRKAAEWIPASQLAAETVIGGVLGMIYGCYVVLTNKIKTTDSAYIVKPGAVAIFMKRDVNVETARDFDRKGTKFGADKHYAAYLYDPSKIVKIGTATLNALTVTQKASIDDGKAAFDIAGYPTNLSHSWKAYFASPLDAALAVAVGDEFENAAGKTHAAFASEYVPGQAVAATNLKFFQVIYVDGAGKIRSTGNVKAATTIS